MTERTRGSGLARRITSTSLTDFTLTTAFVAALIASAVVLFTTIAQPLLEAHSFRQTQTAITSYWFIHDGFTPAYQTPISGYPWKIPLEFPFFQALVAWITELTHLPLDEVGRGLSYVFFVATLVPVALLCRSLALGHRVFLIFGTVYLLSPQYLFWGRTFMMESTATFLSVAAIAAVVPFFFSRHVTPYRALAVVVLASLAVAQKITTGLPVVMVLVTSLAIACLRAWMRGDRNVARVPAYGIALLAIPVLLGLGWTYYTDLIKEQSDLAKLWTSTGLRSWNIGTLHQRVSSELFRGVIWTRSLKVNAGSYVGLAVLGFFYVKETRRSQVIIAAVTVALFLLPFLLFTNLHIAHNYYQTSTTIYLIFLLALALTYLANHSLRRVFLLAFALVLVSNLAEFKQVYWPIARASFTPDKNTTLAIAKLLREDTPAEARVLLYGYSMSSEVPYYAERKSATVPDEYPLLEEPLKNPERFFGKDKVGALVVCPAASGVDPSKDAIAAFVKAHGPFRETAVDNCRVFVATASRATSASVQRTGG